MPKVKFNKEAAFSYMHKVMQGDTMSEILEMTGRDLLPTEDYIVDTLANYPEGYLPQELEQAIYDLFEGVLDTEAFKGEKLDKLHFLDAAYIHLLADICQEEDFAIAE
jgi:hypothetical protein